MKLSDVKGERTLDVIAEIVEPVANLAEDKEVAELFRKKKLPQGRDAKSYLLERLKSSLPPLLKRHKTDVIAILAAVEGVSMEQYAGSLNLVKLSKDCIELLTDDAFIELFISAQSEGSSGSAPENTAAPLV